MISHHVTALINQVDAAAAGDHERTVAVTREAYAQMFEVGDALGTAIADQFPDRFTDLKEIPPTDATLHHATAGDAGTVPWVAIVLGLGFVAGGIGFVVIRRSASAIVKGYCESCGRYPAFLERLQGGGLRRTDEGVYLCPTCRALATTPVVAATDRVDAPTRRGDGNHRIRSAGAVPAVAVVSGLTVLALLGSALLPTLARAIERRCGPGCDRTGSRRPHPGGEHTVADAVRSHRRDRDPSQAGSATPTPVGEPDRLEHPGPIDSKRRGRKGSQP